MKKYVRNDGAYKAVGAQNASLEGEAQLVNTVQMSICALFASLNAFVNKRICSYFWICGSVVRLGLDGGLGVGGVTAPQSPLSFTSQ